MTKLSNVVPEQAAAVRKPWIRPAVEKIAAGQAEVGQRPSTGDGQFTLS